MLQRIAAFFFWVYNINQLSGSFSFERKDRQSSNGRDHQNRGWYCRQGDYYRGSRFFGVAGNSSALELCWSGNGRKGSGRTDHENGKWRNCRQHSQGLESEWQSACVGRRGRIGAEKAADAGQPRCGPGSYRGQRFRPDIDAAGSFGWRCMGSDTFGDRGDAGRMGCCGSDCAGEAVYLRKFIGWGNDSGFVCGRNSIQYWDSGESGKACGSIPQRNDCKSGSSGDARG